MTSTSDVPTSLAIAVPTFRRPERLHFLLPQLISQLEGVHGRGGIERTAVLVVDNDPAGGAAAVVEGPGNSTVRYALEPRPGISHARNRLLELAVSFDLLAFIDDDESPHDGWLGHLLDARASFDATAVAGRVVSEADGELDPFVVSGEFLARRHRDGLATGAPLERAATNNLLLDLRWVRRHDLRFDVTFGQTGGEDSVFTSTLTRLGGSLVWCDEAVVTDHVPASRMTPTYMLRRSHSMENTSVFVELALCETGAQRFRFRASEAVRQSVRALHGAVLVLRASLTRSLRDRARGRRALTRAAGGLSALAGRRAVHYAPDTTPARRSGETVAIMAEDS